MAKTKDTPAESMVIAADEVGSLDLTPPKSPEQVAVEAAHVNVETARQRVRECRSTAHPDFEVRLGDLVSAAVQLGRAMEVLARAEP